MKIRNQLAVGILSFFGILSQSCVSSSEGDSKFDHYPVYEGNDLGVTVRNDSSIFKLWAPEAEQVRLNIYESWDSEKPEQIRYLVPTEKGVWSVGIPGELYGKFYTFNVYEDERWLDETPGIWAKAVGPNGKRAAIIDFSTTNPEGWADDKGPETKNINDAIIYEMHHRDFSMHESSGIENKGKFLALTEQGTKSPDGLSTGIDHLKELGVTHVHILPSYDYNSVDELDSANIQYNWGYDPQNYNAPEGSYSTNPMDPAARVREMKEMVKSLHDNGIGVIMDVVYNHTAENDNSNFSLTVPGYFYRHNEDGSYSDASGCGNETASERKMMSDFIVNSVKYWAEEYHIDGFRFDLMGIHDIETMNRVAKELKQINPSIIIYGEGWTAGSSPLEAEKRALKENVSKLQGVAVFSDDIRDAVKGHYSDAKDRGFATGKIGNEETVKIGIVGATSHPQVDYEKGNNSKFAYASSPLQVINYVSCHDDLTLTDKLNISMAGSDEKERQRAAKLAQTIVFTSQGTPFMFAGEEIFRDKKGVHNSYKSPDSINAIDWSLKEQNSDLLEYYKGLIELRKSHPAFRMTSSDDIAANIVFDEGDDGFISYSLKNNANGDEWDEIKVLLNGSDDVVETKIEQGDWIVIAEDGRINPKGMGRKRGGKISIPHRSATILARK
ncbi:MAG: type I pullulanase [Muribaculaceae bacterium]|nr:type I pullulanase [Muribaculaceae bacterium]